MVGPGGRAVKFLRAHWRLILVLVVALLPRLWQLGRFITADEILFLGHARQFLQGLARGDFSDTLGIGYPGVTSAWVHALGLMALFGLSRLGLAGPVPVDLSLSQFLAVADAQPLPYYVAGRVATGILVSILLFLFYILARRLFAAWGPRGENIALLSALLLALDPYVLGYSRLMHIEVTLALLMFLATMSWWLWLREGGGGWLGLAGLFSGMALLTKTTALLLAPIFLGLAWLVWMIERPGWRQSQRAAPAWWGRTVAGWLGVLGLAALVFCLLWPAMWEDASAALELTFGKLWVDREAGEGNLGMFWMGSFVEDPGPAFYPVALMLKLSPLMLLGLAASLLSLRKHKVAWILWAYALFYLLVMTVASKKSVRYLLPAYVALAPLAAYGLWRLGGLLFRRGESVAGEALAGKSGRGAMWVILVALMLVIGLPYAPYYLSYYNPLLLGWRWAPEMLLVGWGEGLGDAALYLNQQASAAQASVAAWYDWTFAPFFQGQTLPLSTENAMQADFTVFYVNQVQRNIPDPNLIAYFQRRQPEHVVRLNGIDYAWVYPSVSSTGPMPASATPVGVTMGDDVVLEGYQVRPQPVGQGVIVTLYWRALQAGLPDYFVYVRAIDGQGQIQARADSPPVMGFWPTSRWEAGELVADEQVLSRLPETPPGTYRLEVGMYDPQTWAVLEPASGERGAGGGLLLGEVSLP